MPGRARSNPDLLVVVLAAGEGRRMRSRRAKVMHELAGQPLLAYPIALARQLGAGTIAVVTARGPERDLKRIAAGCRLVVQPEPRGTGDALARVPAGLRSHAEVLVLYGDVPLITLKTGRLLLQARRRARLDCVLLAAHIDQPGGYGRVLMDGAPRVVEEADARPAELDQNLINTGVCCFRSEALWPALRGLKPSPKTGELYLTELFAAMPRRGVVQCAAEEALGVNDRWQLAEAEAVVRARINRAWSLAGVTIVDPATTYIDAAVRLAGDTRIEPFTFLRGTTAVGRDCSIGPFAELSDCRIGAGCTIGRSHLVECTVQDGAFIGPFNRIRAGSAIGSRARIGSFAEIKSTRIGADTDVHHFSYLGDAALGRGVNIGAGTVTANYDGRAKHPTVIGAGAFVGTDSTLVAPVRVGVGAYTAAGSVITRDVPGGALAIERTDQRLVPGWSKRRRRR
jgi:bifunctional UDP-N-acetylglucosamine pyrophosphorylase/glucosamine-1-phosphate N-acetyltransferase